MEKEKPYKCDICGKRYKNLNGLKYHKGHSTPCNPEMKSPRAMPISNQQTARPLDVTNVGLAGIGEEF